MSTYQTGLLDPDSRIFKMRISLSMKNSVVCDCTNRLFLPQYFKIMSKHVWLLVLECLCHVILRLFIS